MLITHRSSRDARENLNVKFNNSRVIDVIFRSGRGTTYTRRILDFILTGEIDSLNKKSAALTRWTACPELIRAMIKRLWCTFSLNVRNVPLM